MSEHPLCEPISIIIFNYKSNKNSNAFVVEYQGLNKTFVLKNYKTNNKKKLIHTTLFKYDYYLLEIFYNYYTNQGVEKFVLYYNGKINEEIKNIFNKDNILLIEWNFPYWNTNSLYQHHAQIGQINHALYKYGKDETEYMIFNDFDEYMYVKNKKLIELLDSNADTYAFLNSWSETIDNKIPKILPKTLKIGKIGEYKHRSKCIHKVNNIFWSGIHYTENYNSNNPIIESNYYLFHFYNWSGKQRFEETNEIIHLE